MVKNIFIFLALVMVAVAGHFIAYKILNPPAQLEFVVLLAIVIIYPVVRYPIVGLYSLFIFLPFVPFIRRLYYLLYARPDYDPLIAIGYLLIALMLMGLYFDLRERSYHDSRVIMIRTAILYYFIYLLARTFILNSLGLKSAILHFGLYGPSVLLFWIGMFYAPRLNHLRSLWIVTLVIGIFAAFYGLKQLYFGYSQSENLWFSSISFSTLFIKGIARPFSFFQSPAAFADYMELSLIGVIILFGWTKFAGNKLLLIIVPLLFYGSLITSVRSNWIGIMISLLLWLTLVNIKGLRNRILVMCVFILAYFIFIYVDSRMQETVDPNQMMAASSIPSSVNQSYVDLLVRERASAIANPFEEHSLLSRFAMWKFLLSTSTNLELAVFGRGPGTLNADSLYFTYLGNFGYPGLIFIIFIVVYFIIMGFKLIDNAKSTRVISLAKGITVLNIAFAIINTTGTHIHSFPGDAYFWFWNGVLAGLLPLYQTYTDEPVKDAPASNTRLSP
jgi:hypothetical protein